MKNLIFVLLALFAFGVSTASADTLTFVGTGPNYVGSTYTYPYSFEINGATSTTQLMCLSYDNEIVNGESWTVTTSSLVGLSSKYLESAWLLNDANKNPANAINDNLAAWGLFSSDTPITSASNVQLSLAITNYVNVNPNDFVLYVPTTPANIKNGAGGSIVPQTFIGVAPTPEPSSLLLFGGGLLFMAFLGKNRILSIKETR
jgi:hypothetical protein